MLQSYSFESGSSASIAAALASLKTAKVRIIVCLTFESDFNAIVSGAMSEGLMGEKYHWIFGNVEITAMTTVSDSATINALKGSTTIMTTGAVAGYAPWESWKTKWASYNPASYNSKMPSDSWGQLGSNFFSSSTPNPLTSFVFDAVASVGIAACRAWTSPPSREDPQYPNVAYNFVGPVNVNSCVQGCNHLKTT